MPQKTYCAIIGDINRSRLISNRAQVQRKFAGAVEKINTEFRRVIASKFLITLGDEFQGLLTSSEQSYDLIRRFEDLVEPTQFAFGVGVGAISTPMKKEALGMDGEAFHRTRNALGEAKHKKRTICYSFNADSQKLVNVLVALMDRQWHRLTRKQRRIAQLLKEQSALEVAERLRVSPQSISKAKQAGGFAELDEAAGTLRDFLSKLNQP